MPSVKNPNGPSQNRLKARASKARKRTSQSTRSQGKDRASRADEKRGAREGILPTSGPRRALGKKQQQKLERRMANALRRKEEMEGKDGVEGEEEGNEGEDGEEMRDAQDDDDEEIDDAKAIAEQMAMDSENIS